MKDRPTRIAEKASERGDLTLSPREHAWSEKREGVVVNEIGVLSEGSSVAWLSLALAAERGESGCLLSLHKPQSG